MGAPTYLLESAQPLPAWPQPNIPPPCPIHSNIPAPKDALVKWGVTDRHWIGRGKGGARRWLVGWSGENWGPVTVLGLSEGPV